MAAPIEIGIASETKAFKQGIESGVTKPLEDAADKLDDLGKSRGPDQLERSLEDAQAATKQLGREIERTADDIEKDFRESYRSVKRSAEDGMSSGSTAAAEFKSEATQNFAEVASSFDGSMESIADGAQATLAGAGAAIGGVGGIAIGVLGAAAGAALTGFQEHAREMQEAASDAFNAMVSDGIEAFEELRYQERLAEAFDPGETRDKIQGAADALKLPFETAAAAYAGNAEAIEKFQARYQAVLDSTSTAAAEDAAAMQINYKNATAVIRDQLDAYEQARAAYQEYNDALLNTTGIDEQTHQARTYRDELAKIPGEIKTSLEVDISAAERKVQQFIQKDRTIRVAIDGKSYGRY